MESILVNTAVPPPGKVDAECIQADTAVAAKKVIAEVRSVEGHMNELKRLVTMAGTGVDEFESVHSLLEYIVEHKLLRHRECQIKMHSGIELIHKDNKEWTSSDPAVCVLATICMVFCPPAAGTDTTQKQEFKTAVDEVKETSAEATATSATVDEVTEASPEATATSVTANEVKTATDGVKEPVGVHMKELKKFLEVFYNEMDERERAKIAHSLFQYLIKNQVLTYPECERSFNAAIRDKLIQFIQIDDKELGEYNPALWVLDTIKKLFPYRLAPWTPPAKQPFIAEQAIDFLMPSLAEVEQFKGKTREELDGMSLQDIRAAATYNLEDADELFAKLHEAEGPLLLAATKIIREPWRIMLTSVPVLKSLSSAASTDKLRSYCYDSTTSERDVKQIQHLATNELRHIDVIAAVDRADTRSFEEKWSWAKVLCKQTSDRNPWAFLSFDISTLQSIVASPPLEVACALNSSINSAEDFQKTCAILYYQKIVLASP